MNKDIDKIIKKYIDKHKHKINQKFVQSAKRTYQIDRNEKCPCGSGQKYKNCCGKVIPDKDYEHYLNKLSPFINNANPIKNMDKEVLNKFYIIAKEAAQNFPVNPLILDIAGSIAYELNNFNESAAYIQKHYNIVKNEISEDSLFTLIHSLLELNRTKKAEKLITEVIKDNDSLALLMTMTEIKFSLGKVNDGYKYGIRAYEKSGKDLYLLNRLLRLFIQNKLYEKAFPLLKKNYFELEKFGIRSENIRYIIENLVDAVFLIDNPDNLTDDDYFAYIKKISEIINYINPKKSLKKKKINKLKQIIPKQYDISFFLVRLFYVLENYEWIAKNEKILLDITGEEETINNAILDANFELRNYKYLVEKLANELEINILNSTNYVNTYNQFKYYLYSLYEVKDKEHTKSFLKFLNNTVKKDTLQFILLVLTYENYYKGFEVLEYLYNLDDFNFFNKKEMLEVQLAVINMNFTYLEDNEMDITTKKIINKKLKEYEKIENDSFIYHYTNWLLNRIENKMYELDLDKVIDKKCYHLKSAELKYLVILKLSDPKIIIENPPETDLIDKEDRQFYKLIAEGKEGDIYKIQTVFDKFPDRGKYIENILDKIMDEYEIEEIYNRIF